MCNDAARGQEVDQQGSLRRSGLRRPLPRVPRPLELDAEDASAARRGRTTNEKGGPQ